MGRRRNPKRADAAKTPRTRVREEPDSPAEHRVADRRDDTLEDGALQPFG
jgi:hypothetical protein